MSIILVAINAKYIHSSLAAYSLYSYLSPQEKQYVQVKEFTVNQSEDLIVSELLRLTPSVLAFSCYIWNIEMVASIVETFKAVMPHVKIIVGGPEVSHGCEIENVDMVVQGEGEAPFKEIVGRFMECQGTGEPFLHQPAPGQTPVDLENIPFPYTADMFETLQNRIIYYETSRGCINRCGYCLSSTTEGVRFLPLARAMEDLGKLINAKVRQVKFVDRTFNSSKHHAMEIWQYLIANDNGVTNFHFEIAGELLDHEQLTLLSTARKGLFQFEIGVQSTNPTTLHTIQRTTNSEKIFQNVTTLMSFGNIHLHLDLIVGLPHEDYASFKQSFNDVFACYPHKLQLGFLKLLKGSQLRTDAEKYGIKHKKAATYNVLQTNWISFEEVNHLHKIEHMVESFYGGVGFGSIVRFMIAKFTSPFHFFDTLATYWEENQYHMVSHKKLAMYSILHGFGEKHLPQHMELICELLKFDMLLQENIRTFPPWINAYYSPDNKLITRTTGVHSFIPDVAKWLHCEGLENCVAEGGQLVLCFDYSKAVDEGRCEVAGLEG